MSTQKSSPQFTQPMDYIPSSPCRADQLSVYQQNSSILLIEDLLKLTKIICFQNHFVVSYFLRVMALNLHRPEKKKRKKLMKDSLYLAAMLRRFTREKEEMKKRNPNMVHPHSAGGVANKPNSANSTNNLLTSNSTQSQGNTVSNDLSLAELTSDPAVMSLLGSANEDVLQDLLGDLDFSLTDTDPQNTVVLARHNGVLGVGVPGHKPVGAGGQGRGLGSSSGLYTPPPLPDGLPAPLIKRIEDLRAVSQM